MIKYGAYVGRFNPTHKGHIEIIRRALDQIEEKLILIIGSANEHRTQRNPFTIEERIDLIILNLNQDELGKIIICQQDDLYNPEKWATSIRMLISEYCLPNEIGLFGYEKDATSYYLKMFPEYENFIINEIQGDGISSTQIRKEIFDITNDQIKLNKEKIKNCENISEFTREYLLKIIEKFD